MLAVTTVTPPVHLQSYMTQIVTDFEQAGILNSPEGAAAHQAMLMISKKVPPDAPVTPILSKTLEAAVFKLVENLIDQRQFDFARGLIEKSLQRFPNSYDAYLSFGRIAIAEHKDSLAASYFQHALGLSKGDPIVYKMLATVYERLELYEAADRAWRLGYPEGCYSVEPAGANSNPFRLLVLASCLTGNVRLRKFIMPPDFEIRLLTTESYHEGVQIPDCDAVWNIVGDAELCPRALVRAKEILARCDKPVINHPDQVMLTGRPDTPVRLGKYAGVIAPRVQLFPRLKLLAQDGALTLAQNGFAFPLLLRSPGGHTGRNFELITSERDLARTATALPSEELLAISYADTSLADGTFRKYRVMSIGGELYPLHLAISYNWKVHYFSAEMETHAEFRAEEALFLNDMAGVLGKRTLQRLRRIFNKLKLDYAGIDFSLDRDGNIVIYEANATMVILLPNDDPKWDYRRPAITRALDAAKAMTIGKIEAADLVRSS